MRCGHSHCMLSCGAVTAIAPQPLHAVRSQPLHAFCHSKLSPHRGQPVCEINIKVNQCVRSIMSPCIPRPMSAHLSVDTFRGRAVNLKPQTMFNSTPTAIYTCSRRLFELFRQLVDFASLLQALGICHSLQILHNMKSHLSLGSDRHFYYLQL